MTLAHRDNPSHMFDMCNGVSLSRTAPLHTLRGTYRGCRVTVCGLLEGGPQDLSSAKRTMCCPMSKNFLSEILVARKPTPNPQIPKAPRLHELEDKSSRELLSSSL